MNYEAWIWIELLAFDNTQSDMGVGAYLERVGFTPYGISLLASAPDFIVLHGAMEHEYKLFPDVCARFGHDGNEERCRQEWTNYQLRLLVHNLQAHRIKVFFSLFVKYLYNKFHEEFAGKHPEILLCVDRCSGVTDHINVLSRLKDGTYYEDLFVSQLKRVMTDYGFDGWHGADCWGPCNSITYSDCSDNFIAQFAECLGDKLPSDFELITNNEESELQKRTKYIEKHLWREWTDFNIARWESFWRKVVDTLRPLGKKTMINSGNTKSAFESIYIFGMDYRKIAALGVDYLVVETVAANVSLIKGGYERHFDFAATLAEMKAFVPEMKILFLHGIKDVVESYDLLRHAPAKLEREVFTLANQYYCDPDSSLARCADGFMACLGDGISPTEWKYLRKQWDMSYSFNPVRAGRLTWIFDDTAIDVLRNDYPANGTWPGFTQIAHLNERYNLQINSICRVENIAKVKGPIIVPNFDLCSPTVKDKILSYVGSSVVLLGRVDDFKIPASAISVTCRISSLYTFGCVVINGMRNLKNIKIPNKGISEFVCQRTPYTWDIKPDYMRIPDEFWRESAGLITHCLKEFDETNKIASTQVLNLEDGVRTMDMINASGVLRTALISCVHKYIQPKFCLLNNPTEVKKVSSFPYTTLKIVDNTIVSRIHSPLHIPPYGIIVIETL